MRDYAVGEMYTGRIIKNYQDDVIVELEQGRIGIILGGVGKVPVGQGSVINVVVTANDEQEILLDFISVSKQPDAEESKSDAVQLGRKWEDIPVGHKQAVTIMTLMRDQAVNFRVELAESRSEYQKGLKENLRRYDNAKTQIMNQFEEEKLSYTNECNKNVEETEARKTSADLVRSAYVSFVSNLPKGLDSEKLVEERSGRSIVDIDHSEVMNAINAKVQAYKTLCKCQISEAERKRNERLDKAKEEYIDADVQIKNRFETKYEKVRESQKEAVNIGFNKDRIRTYLNKIMSAGYNVDAYECPTSVPEYVTLGEIGLTIPIQSQNELEVVQTLELQTSEIGIRQSDEYVIALPYSQRLSEGISLLMRYSAADREYAQGLVQPLLMKLFMSFPAGKLEATMIDPLELGASFPDIPKIATGPNSARIIDTKIWSKEKDIENAIATLRQRLENMTQAYGADQESRLKKEVIRALAITDFPVGFNDTALKDLHTIVRNSAALGVCVLISANDKELEKLKQRNSTLVTEIAQNMVETKVSGKRLLFVGEGKERLFLQPDDMQKVFERKDKIIPLIRDVIEHVKLKEERFESMYEEDIYDSNSWFTGNHEEIAIPIGVKGADTVIKMVLGRGGGSTEHHALIAGPTGAGKSTFLHTLILSTLISYSPDEVQMYLLDFKEGVEFVAYSQRRLPSLRVVALNSEREFGLNVLKELCKELESRTKHFTRYGVSDINSYVKLSDVPNIPKLLLIFDEVQELFRSKGESDSISSECLSCLNKLVMQGRALGIHVILACQDFRNCSGLEAYFSQMVIRIAIKGSEDGASSILNSDNEGIRTLQNQPAGAAIYNGGGGVESANNFFQVSYMDSKGRMKLLDCLHAYYTDPDVAPLYADRQTRVLLTSAEDNYFNCFNRLILEGTGSVEALGTSGDGYGLLLGQGFGKKSIFMPEMRAKERDNLLIVSKDEKMALSMFELSAMSILYEELHTDADKANALVYIVDLFADELSDGECDFDYLKENFNEQIEVAKLGDVKDLLTSLYETVVGRSEGRMPCTERIFLLFFGLNRAKILQTGKMYEDDYSEEVSPREMLQKIIVNGPKYGVNSIVWSESVRGVETMLGERYQGMFDKRIAYGLDAESMDVLVAESEVKALRGKTAVYMDIAKDVKNTHFRPYEVPAQIWIKQYGEAYEKAIKEGGC